MYKTFKLKSGLTVISHPMDSTKAVTLMIMVGAGSRYETKKINGISHFLEHLFFKGSKKYPTTLEISTIMDGIGGINNAGTEKEWTNYFVKCASDKAEVALDVLSSMIKEPIFDEVELEREKGVIVEELNMYRDDPKIYVSVLGEKLMFGDTPLGWDIGGNNSTVKSLKKPDFIKYMNSLYSPSNMVFVVAGNLSSQKALTLSNKYLNDLPKRASFSPKKIIKKNAKSSVRTHFKQTDQAHIMLGYYGPSLLDNEKYTARVLSAILGGGMSSRLFIQIRERRGLAYYIYSQLSSYTDIGYIGIQAGLNLGNLNLAIQTILDEINTIKDQLVPDAEIQKAKDMIKGRIAIALEDSSVVAERIAREFLLTKKLETPEQFNQKIDQVTTDDIKALAAKIFQKQNANLSIIGPFKTSKQFVNLLG